MRKNSIAMSVAVALSLYAPLAAQAAGVTNAMLEGGGKDNVTVLIAEVAL